MNLNSLRVTFVALAFTLSTAQALTVFSDNFDGESLGLNYTGFAQWTVSNGTVDLIGHPSFHNFLPGNGRYVDLDGSTGNAGKMTSNAISVSAGLYVLSFDLAGNQRNNAAESTLMSVITGFGGASYSLAQNAPFTTYTHAFTVTSPTPININLVFEGTGGDNIGMLLDNVKLERRSVPDGASTIGLVGSALLLVAFLRRKA